MPNHCKYIRDKVRDPFPMKYAIRGKERIAIVEEAGVNGLVLFEYYLRMASIENVEITDRSAAEYFGWGIHTAKRARIRLQNTGWVLMDRARSARGESVYLYYLGKDEVKEARRNQE